MPTKQFFSITLYYILPRVNISLHNCSEIYQQKTCDNLLISIFMWEYFIIFIYCSSCRFQSHAFRCRHVHVPEQVVRRMHVHRRCWNKNNSRSLIWSLDWNVLTTYSHKSYTWHAWCQHSYLGPKAYSEVLQHYMIIKFEI